MNVNLDECPSLVFGLEYLLSQFGSPRATDDIKELYARIVAELEVQGVDCERKYGVKVNLKPKEPHICGI